MAVCFKQRLQQCFSSLEGCVQRADFVGLRLELLVLARKLLALLGELLGLLRQFLALNSQFFVLLRELLRLNPQLFGLVAHVVHRGIKTIAQPDDLVNDDGAHTDIQQSRGVVAPPFVRIQLARRQYPEQLDVMQHEECERHPDKRDTVARPDAQQHRDDIGQRERHRRKDVQANRAPDRDKCHRQRDGYGS